MTDHIGRVVEMMEDSTGKTKIDSGSLQIDSKSRGCSTVTRGSVDTAVSDGTVVTAASDKLSLSGNWETQSFVNEGSSAFVTFNPWKLYLSFRNARILTVEPVIFLYMFATYLYFPLYEQYFFVRFGTQLLKNSSFPFPNGSFCLNSSEIDEYKGNGSYKSVETSSNHLLIYLTLANRIPSIISTLILGPLSDRFGRKPVLLIVACGSVLQGGLTLVIVYLNLSVYFFLITAFVAGCCGDFAALLMGSFSYISDVSSKKWLTIRIGIAEAMIFFSGGLGQGLASGLWLQKLDCYFIPPLWLFVGCNAGIIVYVLLFLPEALSTKERERRAFLKPSKLKSLSRGFEILFCQIKDSWKLWLCLVVLGVVMVNGTGATAIAVYFFKAKEPLDWPPKTIGIFQCIQQLSHVLGLLVILPILVVLRFPDALISLIGVLFNGGMNVFVGFVRKTFEMFIVGVIQGVEAIIIPPLRSIMSKAVATEDQGALFSLVASVEVGATMIAGIVYPYIFPIILDHNLEPGTVFFIMAACCVLPLPALIVLLFCRNKTFSCSQRRTTMDTVVEDAKSIPYIPPRPIDPSFECSDSDFETDQLLAPKYHPPPYYGSKDPENLSRSYARMN